MEAAVIFAERHATFAAVDLAECVAMLADDPEARLIAGATDLGVESNLHMRRWPHLVSTEAIAELQDFRRFP